MTPTPIPVPIPQRAFSQPGPNDTDQDYWDGYAKGQANSSIVPSPAGASDYEAYKARVVLLFKQQVAQTQPNPSLPIPTGAPNSYDVGYDNALMDAANWLWINDPASPHNV
jgi:hypothetical protein